MTLLPLQQNIAEALAEHNLDRIELDEAIADIFEATDESFDREKFLQIAADGPDPDDWDDDDEDWDDDEDLDDDWDDEDDDDDWGDDLDYNGLDDDDRY